MEFIGEFTDRNYRDIIELASFSVAIDANHPFNDYFIVVVRMQCNITLTM